MNAVCGDNRFEIIAKVKEHLIKATNIERQPEELKYADRILFRLWQLGYFDSVEKISKLEEQVEDLKSDHEYNLGLMKGLNEKIAELNKANEEHKGKCKTAYIKGIRTMANALKDYDRTDGAWTDYFEHTVEEVLNKLLKESE